MYPNLFFFSVGFWRDDRLRQILEGLTSQIEVCVRLDFSANDRRQLQDCLAGLVENITDESLIKTVNLNVLMHTRSEDSRIRTFALSCSEVLWRSHGGKLLGESFHKSNNIVLNPKKIPGFATETATFIAECGEDENDLVVKAAFGLKDAVESVAGKIDGL